MGRTILSCDVPNCQYTTPYSGNYRKHQLSDHGISVPVKENPSEQKKHRCDECDAVYGSKKKLKEHVKKQHNQGACTSKIVCNICGFCAITQEGLAVHYRDQHNQNHEVTTVIMEDIDVFKQWLKITENQTCSSFYIRRTSGLNTYYRCTTESEPSNANTSFLGGSDPVDPPLQKKVRLLDETQEDGENIAPEQLLDERAIKKEKIKGLKETFRNNLAGLRFAAFDYDGDSDTDIEFLKQANDQIEHLSRDFQRKKSSHLKLAPRQENDGPIREASKRFHDERLEHRAAHNRTLAAKRKAN